MTREQVRNSGRKALAAAGALLLAATLAPQVTSSQIAFAADETRTYSWANGQSQPSIPQTIQGSNGQTMTIVSQTQPVQADASHSITQSFSETRSQQLSPSEIGNVQSIMPGNVYINADGFSGNIPRTNIDQNPVTRQDVRHDTQNTSLVTGSNSRSDIAQTTLINGRTYRLEDVSFTPLRLNSQGIPLTYTAHITYGADIVTEVVDHYDVTAHYQGNLTKFSNEGDWSVSVVYHSDDQPAQQAQQPQQQQQQQQQQQNENRNENQNENRNENQNENANGVSSEFNQNANSNGFGEPENANASDTVSPFTNRNASNSRNSNTSNENGNDNASSSQSPEKKEFTIFGLPWLPLLIGAGILLAALLAAIIILAARKNKKKREQEAVADPMMVAGAAGVAGTAGAAGAGFVGGAAVAYEEEPVSQLIAIGTIEDADGNIDYDQQPRADLAIYPSRHESVPTLVKFPPMVDENGERILFEPEEDRSYWIAIDEDVVNSAVSSDMLVASDDNFEIYRGPLTDQFELSIEQMAAALNGTLEGADVSDELAAYDEIVPFEVAPPKMIPVEVPMDNAYYGGEFQTDDFAFSDADGANAGYGNDGDDEFSALNDMDLDELSFDDTKTDEFDDMDDFGDDPYNGFDDITIDVDDGMPDDNEYFRNEEPLVFEDDEAPSRPEAGNSEEIEFEDLDDSEFGPAPFEDVPSDNFDNIEFSDAPSNEPAAPQSDDFDDIDFEDMDFEDAAPVQSSVPVSTQPAAPMAPMMPNPPQSMPQQVEMRPVDQAAPQQANVFDELEEQFVGDFDDLDDLDFSDADFGRQN